MKAPALRMAKAQMQADPLIRAIWHISEAALAPDRWPAALQSINEAVGASGGNYIFLNKRSGDIEWVSSTGLSVDVNHYVNYYAARDPYRPILEAASRGSWVQVSKCLPETFLRVLSRCVLEFAGAVSGGMRIRGQAAKSIGCSARFWFSVCHPSTLRIAI